MIMINQAIIDIIKESKGFVAIFAGSGSDDKAPEAKPGDKPQKSHIHKIVDSVWAYRIPYGVHIYSAHKQPDMTKDIVNAYNELRHPLLLVAVAGGTDALSGTASWDSIHPVVSCPPDGFNMSCLTNPPGSSNAYIQRPDNVGKYAAQMFSHLDGGIADLLMSGIANKVNELEADNARIGNQYLEMLLQARR